MMESTINTFEKGLNRDVSPSKYPQGNYFDALNIRLITDEELNSFSISNEKGNTNKFNIPTVQAVYKLEFSSNAISSRWVTINGISSQTSTQTWTYESYYNYLTSYYSPQIALGRYKISNQKNCIIITGLDSELTVTNAGSTSGTATITELVPQFAISSIIGSCQLRDYLILVTVGFEGDYSQGSIENGQIWRLKILEDGSVKGVLPNTIPSNVLIPSQHLIYNNKLSLSTEHRLEMYGNYETPEVAKIYFTDNNNNFRHFNVLDTDTFSIPLSGLDIVPEVQFGKMTLVDVTDSGNYQSGMVQYAHQYYNLHGAQSSFSPTTGLIHLTKSSETLINTQLYFGSPVDTATGKAVKLTIENLDKRFTNVRTVSVYYKTYDGSPVINIIDDREVPYSGFITIIDDGNISKGTISDIEFTATGSTDFKCKTFDVKDNILFPANIVENFYDVDEENGYWDSRAYRWNTNGKARIYDIDGNYKDLASLSDCLTVPEDHDCIQTKENQDVYFKFTYTNKRIGGEGTNIKFYFDVESFVDDSTNTTPALLYASRYSDGYTNYANPLIQAKKMSFMRDEVYRFGIVFKDSKGRKSFVKWICDIKMPSIADVDNGGLHSDGQYGFKTFYNSSDGVRVCPLSLIFEVNNLPASAESYEIVRVKRENSDKTILAQGVLSPVLHPNGTSYWFPYNEPRYSAVIANNDKLFNFLSPEINFYKKFDQGNYVHVIGSCLGDVISDPSPAHYRTGTNLYVPEPRIINNEIEIAESRIIPPGYDATYTVNGLSYKNYRSGSTIWNPIGYMCTNLVISVNSTMYTINNNQHLMTEGTYKFNTDYCLANITRKLSGQYGGMSYNGRTNNKYQSCYSETTGNKTHVWGGDTFIGNFELLYGIFDKVPPSVSNQMNFIFPVETSINLSLRHDVPVTKTTTSNSYLMQETAGSHYTALYSGATFIQPTDLYLYNKVYSKENSITSYFSKPINFSNNRTFDGRILSSELKKTNEEIDSWTSFLATNYVDVDATYGPINKIVTFNRKLLFFQDKAVGWASVNERSLITPDASGTTLSLGKGGILDQYFYISRHSGCKHQFSVIYSPNGVYYYDAASNRINVFTGEQNEPISELKGFSSYLKQMGATGIRKTDSSLTGLGVHGVYDQRFNRILWTFNDYGYADEFTIGYNELLKCFESFYSFKPKMYIKFDDFVYSTDPLDLSMGYLHNSGNYGRFYGDTFDSMVEILVNKDPYRSKAFTNLEYILNTTPEANINFETLQVYNNYQDTGSISLDQTNSNKRMRTHRVTIGRNKNSYAVEDRIRSEYAKIRLTFNNSTVPSTKFLLDSIITHYMTNGY